LTRRIDHFDRKPPLGTGDFVGEYIDIHRLSHFRCRLHEDVSPAELHVQPLGRKEIPCI
jgi:hypothetical protein